MIDYINVFSLPHSKPHSLEGIVYESLKRRKTIKTNASSVYKNLSSDNIIKQGQLTGENYYHASENGNSWVEINFEEEWIIPTAFVIADSGNKRRLRSWNIEGSQDGIEYEVLDSHSNYMEFQTQWQINDFRLGNIKKRKKQYRIFRIQQTGPMSESSQTLRVGRLEIFGIVTFCYEKCILRPPNIPYFTCSKSFVQLHLSIFQYILIFK